MKTFEATTRTVGILALLSRGILAGGPPDERIGGGSLGITREKFAADVAESNRWSLVAQMSLRQKWRERGEPCQDGERAWISDWRPSKDKLPTTYAEARKVLRFGGCPRTDDERENVWDFGSDYDVSTSYLSAACERSGLARARPCATAAYRSSSQLLTPP